MQRKITLIISLSLSLTACGIIPVYRPDIKQGNIIEDTKVDRIKLGMTREQVTYLMGEPVLKNSFNQSRSDYVYTLKKSRGKLEEKRITFYFSGNKLTKVSGIKQLTPAEKRELPFPIFNSEFMVDD